MTRNINYPSKYELKEVLSAITNRTFLSTFAQEKGIFITNVNHEQLADEISSLFLDDEDLERIRQEAYQENSQHTLAGFVIESEDNDFDLLQRYQWVYEKGKRKEGQILSVPVRVDSTRSIYKATIEYGRRKAGRIEFLQDEVSSFDFFMEEVSPGTWKVEVDCNRSTDTKELRNLLQQSLNREDKVIAIEQNLLTTPLSIQFFDDLAKEGMDKAAWRLYDIKHLTLKHGGSDDAKSDEEETEEVKDEELAGITQAILQGQNLRDNQFVKQSVKSGYRFNAMTYEFHHLVEPYAIQIKAEFKGRPKVFEVSIVGYDEIVGTTASRQPASINSKLNREIRSEFWNNSKVVYDKLISGKTVSTKTV